MEEECEHEWYGNGIVSANVVFADGQREAYSKTGRIVATIYCRKCGDIKYKEF